MNIEDIIMKVNEQLEGIGSDGIYLTKEQWEFIKQHMASQDKSVKYQGDMYNEQTLRFSAFLQGLEMERSFELLTKSPEELLKLGMLMASRIKEMKQ